MREFIAMFRGMTGTAKQKAVLESTGTARMSLAEFYANGGNRGAVEALRVALRDSTKPVKPADLGVHIAEHFAQAGAEMETFEYVKQTGENMAGLPFVLEVAFAWCGEDAEEEQLLITGLNFAPTLINPFRSLGYGGTSLDEVLTVQRAGSSEPIIVLVHLACPVMSFIDRGKSQLVLDNPTGAAVEKTAQMVTRAWCRQRRQEEKHEAEVVRRRAKLTHSRRVTFKAAAYQVMVEAWMKASARGTSPATARQIMYAARRQIQELVGKPLNDAYFTQTLLPDYVVEHGVDRDVVFDARGRFREPNTDTEFGVGTLEVRDYLERKHPPLVQRATLAASKVVTVGPEGRYGAIFYIEKEGFDPLWERVQLAARFDLALMSTKGMSVTAARQLVAALCGTRGVPLLIAHDFDKAGFSIAATIRRNTRRYRFAHEIKVVDLGLRLADVRALGLEHHAEEVHDKGSRGARARNLRRNGATEEEVEFLLDRRVELNALASDELVAFIERKLTEHGIGKIIPDQDLLARTYEAGVWTAEVREVVERVLRETAIPVTVPDDLRQQVEVRLRERPALSWDDAVRILAEGGPDDADYDGG